MTSVFSADSVKSSFPLWWKSIWRNLKLAEYFTKGRILTIHGNVKIDQWEGKDGTPHAQLRVHAKYIDFLNIGKKQEGANAAANAAISQVGRKITIDVDKALELGNNGLHIAWRLWREREHTIQELRKRNEELQETVSLNKGSMSFMTNYLSELEKLMMM